MVFRRQEGRVHQDRDGDEEIHPRTLNQSRESRFEARVGHDTLVPDGGQFTGPDTAMAAGVTQQVDVSSGCRRSLVVQFGLLEGRVVADLLDLSSTGFVQIGTGSVGSDALLLFGRRIAVGRQ